MVKEKPGFMTAKAISIRMKAKGLQKLRWYCQMCEKQCRDENGFKCHLSSDSHQRKLLIVAEKPDKFVSDFSRQFHAGFMDVLRRSFGTRRVEANTVYQEYIRDRDHVHMNGTRWTSLTGYVQFLGNSGACLVDQCDEDKWYIKAIPNDPESIVNSDRNKRRERTRLTDSEREKRFLKQQMERDRQKCPIKLEKEIKEFSRDGNVSMSIHFEGLKRKKVEILQKDVPQVFAESAAKRTKRPREVNEKKNALDQIIEDETRQKRRNRIWLRKDIVVKIIDSDFGSTINKKGVIRQIERSEALLEPLTNEYRSGSSKTIEKSIWAHQDQLETVIPSVGRLVKIVNGAYMDFVATLDQVNQKEFCVNVTICRGPLNGRKVLKLPFDDVCKLYVD